LKGDRKVKRTIGFIGLGIMGRPMTKRLLEAGYPLVVYDIVTKSVDEIAAAGAQRGASIADVAKRGDVVISMLPDSPDVEAVAFGPDGVIANIRPGCTYVDMSTISPTVSERVAAEAKPKGIKVLDAPVSGGDVGAIQGTLSIMVGGDQGVFDDILPIFEILGKRIVLVGKDGAGQVVKACNQIVVALTLEAVGEALVLGTKAGVDPAKIVEVLSGGLARCGVLENRGMRIVNRDFQPGFRIRLHYKDLGIAMAAGKAYDVPLPVTALVHEMFKRLRIAGRGELDHSGIVTFLEDLAGVEVKKH
jgi:2-hydroxy-3-oxopropionate reductase